MNSSTQSAHGGRVVATLTRRELVRLIRQPSRLVATIATPVLLWVLLASGFARSFRLPEAATETSYALYLLPGMLLMTVLFSSIFGAISLIEDRHEGFLQSVLVSPAPRWSIAAAKLSGTATVAIAQALVLLPAALFLSEGIGPVKLGLSVLALLSASLGIAGLSLAMAWWIDSVSGFHGMMNLVLLPMWLLSGAVFPLEGSSGWMHAIMLVNPMTWCHMALRGVLLGGGGTDALAWVGAGAFALSGLAAGWLALGRGVRRL